MENTLFVGLLVLLESPAADAFLSSLLHMRCLLFSGRVRSGIICELNNSATTEIVVLF